MMVVKQIMDSNDDHDDGGETNLDSDDDLDDNGEANYVLRPRP